MKFEDILAESYTLEGPLGAAAFVVLRALQASGADANAVAEVRALLDAHLPRLGAKDGALLVHVLEQRLAEHGEDDAFDGTVKLSARLTMVEAHIVHDALSRRGLATQLRHEHLAAADFPNPGTDVEIWVPRRDLARAKAILAEIESESTETIACPQCAEQNPAHFETCWNCSALLTPASAEAED
ncbi:MAG: DUF2007 domain-containing protein [Myxococcales bacterium]|nr:DUF2007 domain-containing protein [Myxococcales bacterium]